MPFQNSAVGGITLVRPAIQSPNYVPGVAGWHVDRDGSAEFNSLTSRGIIVVGPTAGEIDILNAASQLIIKESPTGIDIFNVSGQKILSINQAGITAYHPSTGAPRIQFAHQ